MLEIWIIIAMLALSVFFSGIEIALLSLNPYLVNESESRPGRLYARRYELVSTMLIGNNIAVVGATLALDNVVTLLSDPWLKAGAFSLQTVLFFLIGEALPKNIFRKIHTSTLELFYPIIMLVYYLFRPASLVFLGLTRKLFSLFPQKGTERQDDLVYFIGSHFLTESKPISRGLLSLKNTKAEEIMTPMPELFSLSESMSVRDSLETMKSTSYTRYPVYRNRGDNIIGYINVFDILTAKDKDKIGSLIYDPVFIPDQLPADQLLFRMQKHQWPLVFLVNEYGAVAGMVTLENIAEEIVDDEIITREQEMERPDIAESGEGLYLLDGSLNIDDFNNRFQVRIVKKGFETIAGYAVSRFGYIPQKGEKLDESFGALTVEQADARTVEQLLFEPNAPGAPKGGSAVSSQKKKHGV